MLWFSRDSEDLGLLTFLLVGYSKSSSKRVFRQLRVDLLGNRSLDYFLEWDCLRAGSFSFVTADFGSIGFSSLSCARTVQHKTYNPNVTMLSTAKTKSKVTT